MNNLRIPLQEALTEFRALEELGVERNVAALLIVASRIDDMADKLESIAFGVDGDAEADSMRDALDRISKSVGRIG